MGLIQNYDRLNTTPERKIVLDILEAGLNSIQPEVILHKNISVQNNVLTIQNKTYSLTSYQRVFLIGIGKGAAKNSLLLEQLLANNLTEGFVIDITSEQFSKIHFTQGTHPHVSAENINFTQLVVNKFREYQLTEKDLVIFVVCGGGSAMFALPKNITLEQKFNVDKILLESGANITDMNTIRKHLSAVKGGGLAKILYPAEIVTLIYSDVPGNDISTIASGPTVKDQSTIQDVERLIQKYPRLNTLNLPEFAFIETPKDDKYFLKSKPFLILSNFTALQAMRDKAEELGYSPEILSDSYQAEANIAGKVLINLVKPGQVVLAGGETTLTVTGNGDGGRNQQLILAAISHITKDVTIAAIGSDGWDNSQNAGAIADIKTVEDAKLKNLNPQHYLDDNNSLHFFEDLNSHIITGNLPSNISDLIVVLKKHPVNTDQQPIEYVKKEDKQTLTQNKDIYRYIIPELHEDKIKFLEEKANTIRQLIIQTLLEAGSGHSAGSLGMADIFAAFYFHILNLDPENVTDPNRDRLVLSNGHICPVQYVTMALAGFFPVDELKTLRKLNSRLQGHPHRTALPGLESTSGPLGEGLSQAIGMALAARLDHRKYQVYCLMGDGEQNEGNIWEAAMMASKYKLNNLTVIIDRNNIQIDGFTENVMPLEDLQRKYEAFGWEVIEIDGHNFRSIVDAVREANSIYEKPTCIIAHTIPGRGVQFMEKDFNWHGKSPNSEEAKKALAELRTLQGNIKSEHE